MPTHEAAIKRIGKDVSETKEDIKNLRFKFDELNENLKTIAIQDVQIKEVTRRVSVIETTVTNVDHRQASCPREQIKWLWGVCISLSCVLMASAFAIIHQVTSTKPVP